MIPHNWKAAVCKMAAPDAADYLSEIVRSVESALVENDLGRVQDARLTLGLSPQHARVALVLYGRRGLLVSHERLTAALQSKDSQGQMDALHVAICYIRRAVRPLGGYIISHHGIGYEMNCPDIPQLERKDP